jgi:hypothetical protein
MHLFVAALTSDFGQLAELRAFTTTWCFCKVVMYKVVMYKVVMYKVVMYKVVMYKVVKQVRVFT